MIGSARLILAPARPRTLRVSVGVTAFLAVIASICAPVSAQSTQGGDPHPVAQMEETVELLRPPSGGLILVPVRLEGKVTATFVLDTGAPGCTISNRLVKELKLRRQPRLDANGKPERLSITDGKPAEDAIPKQLKLGAMTFDDASFIVVSYEHLPFSPDVQVDGTIGLQILRLLAFKVDFFDRKVTFWYPGNLTDAQARNARIPPVFLSPLEFRDYRLLVHGKINNSVEETFTLDTGTQQTYVGDAAAAEAHIIEDKKDSRRAASKSTDVLFYPVESVTVGTLSLSGPSVGVLKPKTPNASTGILGLNALTQHVLFIDVPGRRFYAGLKAKELAK